MKKFIKFVLIVAFVFGGWALAAASLHVVRAPGTMAWGYIPVKVQLVPKNNLTFRETYVDTTKWSVADVTNHPTFIDRLQQANKIDLVKKAMETPAPVSVTVNPAAPANNAVGASNDTQAAKTVSSTAGATPATNAQQPTSIFDFSGGQKK